MHQSEFSVLPFEVHFICYRMTFLRLLMKGMCDKNKCYSRQVRSHSREREIQASWTGSQLLRAFISVRAPGELLAFWPAQVFPSLLRTGAADAHSAQVPWLRVHLLGKIDLQPHPSHVWTVPSVKSLHLPCVFQAEVKQNPSMPTLILILWAGILLMRYWLSCICISVLYIGDINILQWALSEVLTCCLVCP